MGLVAKALQSDDELVRKVVVCVIVQGEPKTYVRPINELVILLPE